MEKPKLRVYKRILGESMVRIDCMSFGWIIVDGKKHRHDIVIFPNGEVKRRKGGFLMFGSHSFKRKELEELCRNKMDVLVLGTCTDGVATISDEARKFLENLKVTVIELPSEDAIRKFNELVDDNKKSEP